MPLDHSTWVICTHGFFHVTMIPSTGCSQINTPVYLVVHQILPIRMSQTKLLKQGSGIRSSIITTHRTSRCFAAAWQSLLKLTVGQNLYWKEISTTSIVNLNLRNS